MTPVHALQRAIYLLDRGAAPTSKVRAFQRAIDTIAELPADELEALAADGRLETLPNIGPATGGVIADALAGRPSSYLAKLERETEVSPGDGADLLAALRGDCHSHTTWSDGGASVEDPGCVCDGVLCRCTGVVHVNRSGLHLEAVAAEDGRCCICDDQPRGYGRGGNADVAYGPRVVQPDGGGHDTGQPLEVGDQLQLTAVARRLAVVAVAGRIAASRCVLCHGKSPGLLSLRARSSG